MCRQRDHKFPTVLEYAIAQREDEREKERKERDDEMGEREEEYIQRLEEKRNSQTEEKQIHTDLEVALLTETMALVRQMLSVLESLRTAERDVESLDVERDVERAWRWLTWKFIFAKSRGCRVTAVHRMCGGWVIRREKRDRVGGRKRGGQGI
jgi:hypothetical protein